MALKSIRGCWIEEANTLLVFWIWLSFLDRPNTRDCIFGAVSIRMVMNAVGFFDIVWMLRHDSNLIYPLLIVFIPIPLAAMSAFTIGLWAAVGVATRDPNPAKWLLVGGGIAVLAGSLWELGLSLEGSGARISLWSAFAVASLAVRTVGILLGLRILRNNGVRLIWPPSLASATGVHS